MGLLETAAAALIGGERRTEVAARNVTNINTPGYKREIAYADVASTAGPEAVRASAPTIRTSTLATQGSIVATGNALDLAIVGEGRMLVREGEAFFLTRGGSFKLGLDGAVVDTLGRVLQASGGGDLTLETADVEILPDGSIMAGEAPVGSIGLYDPADALDGVALSAAKTASLAEDEASELKQRAVERSNVVLSDEMVGLMSNQRQIEASAQLVRAYDQLLSQATTTFSRSR
jgi:flagellar basal body rod protein FlgG